MNEFAELYAAIDSSTKTTEKVAAMAGYFQRADPLDAAWAIYFLSGRRPKRAVNSTKLQAWAAEQAGIEIWLFTECYDAVGDLAETITLILGVTAQTPAEPLPLARWVEDVILKLSTKPESEQRELILRAWCELPALPRFLFNKLITGGFRVGVSQDLVQRALSEAAAIPVSTLAHRMMGDWAPTAAFFTQLTAVEESVRLSSHPYPFALAHPLEGEVEQLGDPSEWQVEWKWDGIRAQVIRRGGETFVWSRGEELITDRFPEIRAIGDQLPEGTVIDGEILAWRDGKPLPFAELQKRIGRKTVGKKLLADVPVTLVAFDILEYGEQDFRNLPLATRRQTLAQLEAGFVLAPVFTGTWEQLSTIRAGAREAGTEGFMLKRLDAPYTTGRKRGVWWKWKTEPMTVDAVLVYAQRGSGRRASLYSDYTFAVWDDTGNLVPFAKAYSGLDDEEMRKVDAFVRQNTLEKFGPVRTVTPQLVMELAFEGIQLSKRHKSGIAVRFPRISRWRHDKRPDQADSLASVKALISTIPEDSLGN